MSNGSTSGRAASPRDEMAAFDSLPRDLRDRLNQWCINWSAIEIADQPAGGVSAGPVPVIRPDRRAAYVAAIERDEAGFPGPLVARPSPRQRGRLTR